METLTYGSGRASGCDSPGLLNYLSLWERPARLGAAKPRRIKARRVRVASLDPHLILEDRACASRPLPEGEGGSTAISIHSHPYRPPLSYGIKLIVLAPNFSQESLLHRIDRQPLPLYKTTQ